MTDSDLATLRTECDALKEQLQAEKIVSQEHWDAYEKAEAERDDWMGRAGIAEAKWNRLEAERNALQQQLDEAREIVARMNNTVLGSYGYFTSPSCVDAIDDLKASANRHWNEKQAAEADSARLRAALQQIAAFAQHGDGCPAWPQFTSHFQQATKSGVCTCGLAKLLAGDADARPENKS